jgi:putative endonuclease
MKSFMTGILGRLLGTFASVCKSKNATGRRGERVAAKHLKLLGYRILGSNLRNRFGEVDLLVEAPDGKTIVVVEVKAARVAAVSTTKQEKGASGANRQLRPEFHVNSRKQHQLTALAVQFARQFNLEDRVWRFDVIGVDLCDAQPTVIRHHEGAFESNL